MARPKQHKINEHSISDDQVAEFSTIDNIAFHFGQSAEDISLLRFFYQQKNGFYVDVGAYDPMRYSNTFILHHLYGWRGINIDPSASVIKKFDEHRQADKNIKAAVGPKSKKTYYVFDSGARNTLSEENVKRQENKGDTKIIAKEKVTVIPLVEILDNNLPKGKSIDVLDIDVEGFEMEVLNSNNWSKYRPRIVLIEDYHVAKGSLSQSPLYQYMLKQKYDFVGHHFDTSFYLDTKASVKQLPSITRKEFINNLTLANEKYGDLEAVLGEAINKNKAKVMELIKQNDKLMNDKEKLEKTIISMRSSTSWKITRPLREVNKYIQKKTNT